MSAFKVDGLELGLGLVSIGRPWGVASAAPPDEKGAFAVLERAVELGIQIFDTAPAYASSEERLGRFLGSLEPQERSRFVIMTKAGEHWNSDSSAPFVDHSRDALVRSIDRSLRLLGRVDLLQVHKATVEALALPDVADALDYARSCGVSALGASVSDLEAGRMALGSGLFQALQFPFNRSNRLFGPLLAEMAASAALPILNRPFAMGALVDDEQGALESGRAAFRFIAGAVERGIVLTGTAKPDHLEQNVLAFRTRQ